MVGSTRPILVKVLSVPGQEAVKFTGSVAERALAEKFGGREA